MWFVVAVLVGVVRVWFVSHGRVRRDGHLTACCRRGSPVWFVLVVRDVVACGRLVDRGRGRW